MKTRVKVILIIAFLFVGSATLKYFIAQPGNAQAQPEPKNNAGNIVVKVATIKKEDFILTLDYVGSLKAKDEASVVSKVPGKLVEYAVNEGDLVQKGQLIANIDRDETGLKFELAKVESPLQGVVGRILLDKGETVAPNKDVLAIIVDMDEMVVRLSIPEQDIPYMQKALKAVIKVDAYPLEEFQGEISRVSEMVDAQTRTLPIEIRIPNQVHKLKSGMFARIKIIAVQLKGVLVLHQDAIVQEMGEKFVFLVKNNLADKRKVTLGKRDDGKIEILEGLREGDEVIVFGQQGLKDGAPVVVSKE
jgi:membrane fusion protein (multidrug efflux system)